MENSVQHWFVVLLVSMMLFVMGLVSAALTAGTCRALIKYGRRPFIRWRTYYYCAGTGMSVLVIALTFLAWWRLQTGFLTGISLVISIASWAVTHAVCFNSNCVKFEMEFEDVMTRIKKT